jgi:beta-1,4-mannooligosaccharide/beta-1,4-mannosyl-N-acetylglucosamine phosphorylase
MSMGFRRHARNPILTRASIPEMPGLSDPTSVFNPGAIRLGERILLLLRVQSRGRETFLVPATSDDGVAFDVAPETTRWTGLETVPETIHHVYDPRITRIGDTSYVMVAMDLDRGCRLAVGCTEDFRRIELVGHDAERDLRNGVLFPERIGGRYVRLDRPNDVEVAGGGLSGSEIWLSASDDLLRWRPVAPVIRGRWHYWDELVGAGPPPLKTCEGWLQIYHGVATHAAGGNLYQVGAALLDLDDPTKVLARSRNNCLEPREPYEMVGQVPNVVFPTGLVADEVDERGFAGPSTTLRLYYGAADTVVALATATVAEALAMCED